MPKIITSPVKRFSGTVTLSDPLSYPQVLSWRDAIAVAQALPEGADTWSTNSAILPGVLACVEAWKISGVPAYPNIGNFPATPAISASQLLSWLVSEISELFTEADTIPLES